MTDIKPRVDDDGVPWCDAGCPQALECDEYSCADIAMLPAKSVKGTFYVDVCPHAVRRMALENKAWRSGRLWKSASGSYHIDNGDPFYTIDDAIDALEAEREE